MLYNNGAPRKYKLTRQLYILDTDFLFPIITETLFRAAFTESGSPLPVGSLTIGQHSYDQIVSTTGCSGANDTLACLRTVHIKNLTYAIDQTPSTFSYEALDFAWAPRADGVFLTLSLSLSLSLFFFSPLALLLCHLVSSLILK